jgi:iron complex transport system substrate-binding protein
MRWLLLLLFACLAAVARATPIQVQDDRGQTVRVIAPVRRIVTLSPHLTELVFAAGAGARLVGVSANSDYPPEARRLPVIGGAGKADLERIVALKPDLVLAWLSGGERADVERLASLGIPVIVTEPRHIDDIARHMELIGRLAGTGYEAARAASRFRSQVRALGTRYQSRRPVSVFYQVWHEPLMTINGQHIISEVIRLCGGRNVFESLPTLAPTVSMEALLAANPEAIMVSGAAAQRESLIAEWREHTRLRAVLGGYVYFSDADLTHRATVRMLEGAKQVCENLDSVRTSGAGSPAR